jgi:hypothetical protein
MAYHPRMITRSWLVGAVVAAGCGKAGGADWTTAPLDQTVETKVSGHGFKISMPKGWIFDATAGDQPDDPKVVTKEWRPDVRDYFEEPSVAVAFDAIPAKSLDEFVTDCMLGDDDVVTKKQQTADGFVVLSNKQNNGIVRAYMLKRKGDVSLSCRASQAKNGGLANPDAATAGLARLCDTLVVE